MPTLQKFIEDNAKRDLWSPIEGQEYGWGNTILFTRHPRSMDPHTVEVYLDLACVGYSYSMCFDDRDITDHIEFYKWLDEKFFLEVRGKIVEYFRRKFPE